MKIERNSPCPCGSGKKYKKCCLIREEQEATEAAILEEQEWQEWFAKDQAIGEQNIREGTYYG